MEKLFVLTRDSIDIGGKAFCRYFVSGVTGNYEILLQHRPYFFTETNPKLKSLSFQLEEPPITTMDGKPVFKLTVDSVSDYFSIRDLLQKSNVRTYEADIWPCEKHSLDLGLGTFLEVEGEPKLIGGRKILKNPKVSSTDLFDPMLSTLSLDIETSMDGKRLYSIGGHFSKGDKDIYKVFMVSPGDSTGFLVELPQERMILEAFLKWVKEVDPDLIIGWNIFNFDLRILSEKCDHYKINFNLSRGSGRTKFTKRRKGYYASCEGRLVLDGPSVLRSCMLYFDSYKLDEIGRAVLGTGKLLTGDRGHDIDRLFRTDKRALAQYNIKDCVLVTEIFRKLDVWTMLFWKSHLTGQTLDHLSMVAASFDTLTLPKIHEHNLVASDLKDIKKPKRNEGAYVLQPESGLYSHVVVLDFRSLYPSVIQTFNIDPISLAKVHINPYTTPCGIEVSRDQSYLRDYIDNLLKLRDEAREKGNHSLNRAIKILLNSFYGIMGSEGCRFFVPKLPKAIVGNANWILKETIGFLESFGYKTLYGDTDSLFVYNGGKALDGGFLVEEINSYWRKRLREEYDLDSHLLVKHEYSFDKFLIPFSKRGLPPKKRYCGLTSEGKLKFTGMESVRSDWTDLSKKFQKGLYRRIFQEKDVEPWIREFVWKLLNKEYDHLLTYSKRIRRKLSSYTKTTPPAVKAARKLNKPSRNINYVITLDGPTPLGMKHSGIDYKHYIDKQVKPIADQILVSIGKDFDQIIGRE